MKKPSFFVTKLKYLGPALLGIGLLLLFVSESNRVPTTLEKDLELDETALETALETDQLQTQMSALTKSNPTKEETIHANSSATSFKDILKKQLAEKLDRAKKQYDDQVNSRPIILKKRSYTEIEIANMSTDEFQNILSQTLVNLPTVNDLQKLPNELLHRTPPPILEAGRDLALIKDILNVHPDFIKFAMDFYQTCADNSEAPHAVRALCLTNIMYESKKENQPINLDHYPKEIVELTRLIIDSP